MTIMLQKDVTYNRLAPASAEIAGGRVEACNDATIMGLTPAEYIKQFARWGVDAKFAGAVMRELHRTHLDPDLAVQAARRGDDYHTSEAGMRERTVRVAAGEGMQGWTDSDAKGRALLVANGPRSNLEPLTTPQVLGLVDK